MPTTMIIRSYNVCRVDHIINGCSSCGRLNCLTNGLKHKLVQSRSLFFVYVISRQRTLLDLAIQRPKLLPSCGSANHPLGLCHCLHLLGEKGRREQRATCQEAHTSLLLTSHWRQLSHRGYICKGVRELYSSHRLR